MKPRLPGTLLFSCLLLGTVETIHARELSFEERVRAQEAIERVYYSNLIDARRSFVETAPRETLEKKVHLYLRQSAALEHFWQTRITADMLRAEMERMARQTKLPERLQEIYTALGNDGFVFQETVARAALADRLARSFFSQDASLHNAERLKALALQRALQAAPAGAAESRPESRVVEVVLGSDEFGEPVGTPRRISLPAERFHRLRAEMPGRPGDVGPIKEDGDGFSFAVLLSERPESFVVAIESIPKRTWDEWWSGVAPSVDESTVHSLAQPLPLPAPSSTLKDSWDPARVTSASSFAADALDANCPGDSWQNGGLGALLDGRQRATAVWTGSEIIVWGGEWSVDSRFNSGGRYNPATDTWRPTSTISAPAARSQHSAIWDGDAMIIWGGCCWSGPNTGGLYDPVADSWKPISTVDAPTAGFFTTVWTGSRMIVWGSTTVGEQYDPSTDTWGPIATLGAPSARLGHTAVWTGKEMIVWGGRTQSLTPTYFSDGAAYDPARDRWRTLSGTNAPTARSDHTAVWTGSLMIVWGGFDSTGGVYDPAHDKWSAVALTNAPAGHTGHTSIWTGNVMVVWGGGSASGPSANTGGRYDPGTDHWDPVTLLDAPDRRAAHVAVWTGSRMVVWGGSGPTGPLNNGGRYDPTTDSWTPTSVAPDGRRGHRAVWTGSQMIIWGGEVPNAQNVEFPANSGGRYDPALDTWTPTSLTNAPVPRDSFTLVWGGGRAIVWGGVINNAGILSYPNVGGRYDPVADSWSPTTLDTAPGGRSAHTAVWTGQAMVVWGGINGNILNTGGRYDPVADIWLPTNPAGTAQGRYAHTALWTGREMLVWGGRGSTFSGYVNNGGRYDPATDLWSPMTTAGAPDGREMQAAVWTGRQMLVWGGYNATFTTKYLDTGGRYDPGTDTWSPISQTGNPGRRILHTAIWDGSQLVVWGGRDETSYLQTGARYDPLTDTWSGATSLVNAPLPRIGHTVVWTPSQMLVWGGLGPSSHLNTGGRYCSCAGPTATYYQDADGDGFGDTAMTLSSCSLPAGFAAAGGDCSDSDPNSWGPPSEARDLLLPDDTDLQWSPPASPGSTTPRYDALRSTTAADFVAAATCVVADGVGLSTADVAAPALGKIYFYLIRAENDCPGSTGILGTRSDGTPIAGRACP